MSSSSLSESRRELPKLELNKVSAKASLRNVVSHGSETPVIPGVRAMLPQEKSAAIFDMAVMLSGVKPDWIAAELEVGKSLVSRWRSGDYRESPSLNQIVALGDDFLYCFRKAQNRINGSGRRALLDVMSAMGDLADVVNE